MREIYSGLHPQLHDTTQVDTRQPLRDQSRTGKDRPWAEHRAEGELLAYAYDSINPDKAARLRTCAPRLTYSVDQDGVQHLDNAWFCRVRLCPVCQWRRSLKCYAQAAQIIAEIERQEPGKWAWVMLTLTVRNCAAQELPATLRQLSESWHRLLKLEPWGAAVHGSMRSLEITHNLDYAADAYDTYHPHYHVLLMVRSGYFRSRHYLSRERWAALWQQAARLSYTPQVWVSRVRAKADNPAAVAAAIAEIAKYATKPGDYIIPDDLDMMAQTVQLLDAALQKRRMIAYTGRMKEVKRQLHLKDVETDDDLVHTAEDEQAAEAAGALRHYSWIPALRNYFREVDTTHGEENNESRPR